MFTSACLLPVEYAELCVLLLGEKRVHNVRDNKLTVAVVERIWCYGDAFIFMSFVLRITHCYFEAELYPIATLT